MSKFKSVFYKCYNFLGVGLGRVFNRSIFIKFVIIFSVGFFSRFLVNEFYNINVFIEYTNTISLIYYMLMGFFTVFVHEFLSLFGFVLIPFNFILSCLGNLFNKLPAINWEACKISSIRNGCRNLISCYLQDNKGKIPVSGVRGNSEIKLSSLDTLFTQGRNNGGVSLGDKTSTALFMDSSSNSNRGSKFRGGRGRSAALQGLYGSGSGTGSGVGRSVPSAAARGLYSHESRTDKNIFPINSGSVVQCVRDDNYKLSFKSKISRRVYWYFWKQFGDKYSSFDQFKSSWGNDTKVFQEIKNDLREVKSKIFTRNK